MFSSWDEWNINGRCTVHNNKKCDLPAAPALFTLKRPDLTINKLDVWILTEMTSSLANVNKRSCVRFSTIF